MPSRCRPLLGTFVEISADDADAIEAAFAAIERVHRLMSAHEPDSDVSRINRFAHERGVEVDLWTALVIERALFWSKRSGGAFDIVRAGKSALARGDVPRHDGQPLPEASHWTWIEIRGHSVRLLKPACIDLGGIAKGFAVDRAIDVLRRSGATRGLVNAGGDLACFGAAAWPVSIVDPASRRAVADIGLENCALATSAGLPGDEGRLSFDHLDGRTRSWISVSLLAPTAIDADALTKIVWASGAEATHLLEQADASAFAITTTGEVERIGELVGA